jgi:Uma2 family endonuclease
VTASQKPRRTDDELWAELCALPEHLTGQIIDGELLVQPRPRPRHARVIKRLGRFLSPTDDGDGIEPGQGGWWILIEPGIELPGAAEIAPDLAGWRRSTMPEMDLDAPLRICPAWACEVLSPSNTRTVIVKKQKVYARSGVEWLWLVNADPLVRSLQVFRSTEEGLWLLHSTYADEAVVRVPPFEEIELPLVKLWL